MEILCRDMISRYSCCSQKTNLEGERLVSLPERLTRRVLPTRFHFHPCNLFVLTIGQKDIAGCATPLRCYR